MSSSHSVHISVYRHSNMLYGNSIMLIVGMSEEWNLENFNLVGT